MGWKARNEKLWTHLQFGHIVHSGGFGIKCLSKEIGFNLGGTKQRISTESSMDSSQGCIWESVSEKLMTKRWVRMDNLVQCFHRSPLTILTVINLLLISAPALQSVSADLEMKMHLLSNHLSSSHRHSPTRPPCQETIIVPMCFALFFLLLTSAHQWWNLHRHLYWE